MKDINIDRIFALVYLAVGYGFIYTFSSMNFEKHIAIFTVFMQPPYCSIFLQKI